MGKVKTKRILIVHHDDLDGVCAAAIVYRSQTPFIQNLMEFFPIQYDTDLFRVSPETYSKVYVLDFSVTPERMRELDKDFGGNLIWIDHHGTSIAKLGDFHHVRGIRRDGTAACLLTWEFFYERKEVPYVVKLIGDRDLWKFEYGDDSRYIYDYLMSQHWDVPRNIQWHHWMEGDPKRFLEIGKTLRLARLKIIVDDISYSRQETQLVMEDGYKYTCLKVNYTSRGSISDMGHWIIESMGYDVAWIYNERIKGGNLVRENHLRSRDGINVAAVAEKYGGGGHPTAAGFTEIITSDYEPRKDPLRG